MNGDAHSSVPSPLALSASPSSAKRGPRVGRVAVGEEQQHEAPLDAFLTRGTSLGASASNGMGEKRMAECDVGAAHQLGQPCVAVPGVDLLVLTPSASSPTTVTMPAEAVVEGELEPARRLRRGLNDHS